MLCSASLSAQSGTPTSRADATEKIIIDTDIGGDIDDAFAVGLALRSPEFHILGISSAWGDTQLRARLLSRFLKENGRGDIPIAMGIAKHPPGKLDVLTQALYAQGGPADHNYPDAVDFILQQIKLHPGEITLIAIGPETNLGAAIDRDAATFRKLKRVVLMGGSVYRGYGQFNYGKKGILDATHTRLFTFRTLIDLLKQSGYNIFEVRGIPAPFPLAIGNNFISRFLLRVNQALLHVSKGLFSYQIFVRAVAKPTVDNLLVETIETSAELLRTALVD